MADKQTAMTEQQQKLDALISRVELHQKELGLGNSPFVARYSRYIGSAKSWTDRLIPRRFDEIKIDRAITNLTALVDQINGLAFVHARINERMPITSYALACYEVMDARADDRRVSWLIGPTGVGKSWAMHAVMSRARGASAYIQCDSTWRDSISAITGGIAKAVGVTYGWSAADTMCAIVEQLSGVKMILCIDDVQDMGTAGLKILKSLIDKTACRLVLGIYPTGWASLMSASTAARAEAHQLLGRSVKPLVNSWIKGVRPIDVEEYLRGVGIEGNVRVVSERVTPLLMIGGNLRSLADAVENGQTQAEDESIPLTADLIEAHVRKLLGRELP